MLGEGILWYAILWLDVKYRWKKSSFLQQRLERKSGARRRVRKFSSFERRGLSRKFHHWAVLLLLLSDSHTRSRFWVVQWQTSFYLVGSIYEVMDFLTKVEKTSEESCLVRWLEIGNMIPYTDNSYYCFFSVRGYLQSLFSVLLRANQLSRILQGARQK